MKMENATQNQIIENIDEETQAVQIIRNHENPTECSVVINYDFVTVGYETEYSFDLLTSIKNAVPADAIVIMFNDDELPEAWKISYTMGGITEDRFDRRVNFHPYNDLNEMFCIDDILKRQITGEDDRMADWKVGIIKWYKNHLI